MWNPQGYGSPDLPGNSAQAYYPGDRYVDVVGNDLYFIRGKAEWAAAERLYKAHPSKPYAFAEWGLWGIDDPSFIQRMAQFARTHGGSSCSPGTTASGAVCSTSGRSRAPARRTAG